MAKRLWSSYHRALHEKPIRTNILSGAIVMLLGDTLAQRIERYYDDYDEKSSGSSNSGVDDAHAIVTASPATGHAGGSSNTTTSTIHTKEATALLSPVETSSSATTTTQYYDPLRGAVMVSWAAIGDVPINLALFAFVERTLMRPLGIPLRANFSQSVLKALCFFVPGTVIRMPCFLVYVICCEHITRNIIERGGQFYDPLDDDARGGWEDCRQSVEIKMKEDLVPIIYNGAKLWIPVNTLFFYAVPVELRTLGLSCVAVGWMTYLSLIQHKDRTSVGGAG